MNQNMRKLFDSLRDGVIIVSPDCVVRHANLVAGRSLALEMGKELPADNLCHQIRAVKQGYVKLPLTLEVDAPGQSRQVDRLRVTLLHSPVGEDYLVVVHNLTEAQFYENAVRNLAEMLDQELGAPLADLTADLERLSADPLAADPELAEKVAREGGILLRRLRQLQLLAKTHAHAPMLDQERIPPAHLVSEALRMARPLLVERRIRVSLSGVGPDLPAVYGSPVWLSQALSEYIQHMAIGARNGAEILFSARGGGSHVTFQIENLGLGAPSHLRERVFLPFHRVSDERVDDGLGLGLALCKRVVELHRGHLRLRENDGEITEMSIELPAGGLAEEKDPDGIQQAQRYALDLARLMRRVSGAVN